MVGPLVALVASLSVASVCVRAILAEAGGPALPLDDSFIHLQYAQRLAEGGFFDYVRGEGYTTGATSLLLPALLAPIHAAGLRGLSLVWGVWVLGTLAHAGVALETTRLAKRLVSDVAAIGAGAMCIAFGAFAWFAASGMETMGLAWVLLRTARVAAEWCEAEPARGRTGRVAVEIAALGFVAPLVRPEGALASLIAIIALVRCRSRTFRPARAMAILPLAGPFLVPSLHLVFAGHATSATTLVKWLVANPHYRGATLAQAIGDNVALLITSVLNGGAWTALFLPRGSVALFAAGLLGLGFAAKRAPARAGVVLIIALGILAPCSYLSFLWNRVRYVWPFMGAWFVMIACAFDAVGRAARRVHPRLGALTLALTLGWLVALGSKLGWTVRDLAQSARAIEKQQVTLGRWIGEHLGPDVRIGVNDTGAIAYVGERRTFDVVGLTTEGEARYWVAGAGSRFEHYERLAPEKRPTHFFVYPEWMACEPVLGRELVEATVVDQAILGGVTMVGYEARWDLLGSGALPVVKPSAAAPVDEIDVADLASEAAHAFDTTDAWDTDNHAELLESDHATIADGSRSRRHADSFEAKVPREGRIVARLASDHPMSLQAWACGKLVATIELERGWSERSFTVPPECSGASVPVALRAEDGSQFTSFHYWVFAP